MSHPSPLSPDQVAYFKAHGYLIIENLIDAATLDDWRAQIWTGLGARCDDPQTWPDNQKALAGFRFSPTASEPHHHRAFLAIVRQLGGGHFGRGPDDHGGGGAPIIRWPKHDVPWAMPATGHIDGYPPPDGWAPFMLGFTTYLYDVEPGGGAFIYWPGSHLSTHAYFHKHPEQVDGSYRNVPGGGEHLFTDIAPRPPREFTARAGTVLLWHAYLGHTGSPNVTSFPRFAVIVRYAHNRVEDPAFRYDVPDDLWTHWAV